MQGAASVKSEIAAWCVDYIAKIVELPPSRIRHDTKFSRLGLDSAIAVNMMVSLEDWLGVEIPFELIFDYPTISALSEQVANICKQKSISARE